MNKSSPVVSFSRPRYVKISTLQGFRVGSLILLLPIIVASVALNGPLYFFKYFTQWGILAILISTLLISWTARIEIEMNKKLKLQNLNNSIDPNFFLSREISKLDQQTSNF